MKKGIIIFVIAFILVSLLNSTIKSNIHETEFMTELLDIPGIFLRLVIALAITGPIIKMTTKKNPEV